MSSSELSNALNPNSVVARPRRRHAQPSPTQPPGASIASGAATSSGATVPPASVSVPHRSELELAIVPPQPSGLQAQAAGAPYVLVASVVVCLAYAFFRPLAPHPRNGNPLFELYRIVASAREERQRRIEWEREQEARAAQRQMALEQQVLDMRQEINLLRTYIGMNPNNPTPPAMQPEASISTIPTTAHIEPVSPTAELSPPTPLSPVSPVSHHPEVHLPMFVEGSSSRPLAARDPYYAPNASDISHSPALSVLSPPPSTTPSPQFAPARTTPNTLQTESSELLAPPTPQSIGPSVTPVPASPKPRANPRKRPRPAAEESDRSYSGSEDGSDDDANRVDESWNVSGRCSTIHVGSALHWQFMRADLARSTP